MEVVQPTSTHKERMQRLWPEQQPVAVKPPVQKPPEPSKPVCIEAPELAFIFDCRPRRPSVEKIKRVVCLAYDVTHDDLISKKQDAHLVRPRHIALWLSRKLSKIVGYGRIGERFGNRDHSTVCHGINKIEAMRKNDPAFAQELRELELRICSVPVIPNDENAHDYARSPSSAINE